MYMMWLMLYLRFYAIQVPMYLRTPLIYLFVLEGGFEIETGIRYLNLYMLI